jgi:ABC-type glycerol-3-phosphate transport system substrate-binding protein
MRKMMAAFTLSLLLAAGCAQAAEINVLSVGLVGNGFGQAVDAWSKKTGNTVKLPVPLGPLGAIVAAMETQAADVVILPVGDLAAHAAKFRPGTTRGIGRVLFGLGARANAAGLRIGSEAELKAALMGKTVLINDPASSLNGRMVKAVLDGPGYETVKPVAIPGNAALQLGKRADADYVLNVVPEQIVAAPGVRIVGEIPAAVGLRIDFGGGVAAKAAQAEAARDFLAFLVGPEARALWKANGVASPIP